jgi:hypothetical protein
MSDIKKLLESLDALNECPPGMDEGGMPMGSLPAPMDKGNPVTMNVSLNASGKEHVEDLINMMKNAGMSDAKEVGQDMMPALPMRMDMERLRDIVDEPEEEAMAMEEEPCEECGESPCCCDDKDMEEWANSPEGSEDDVDYRDQDYMTNMMGDDLHKKKKAYAKAQDGDNAMAVESIKSKLMAALAEKKAKPDFLDMDKDGNKKEPMKKAIADKKAKK